MSSRVVVMSPRPGRIASVIDVDLPRPRDEETRESERYFEVVTAGPRGPARPRRADRPRHRGDRVGPPDDCRGRGRMSARAGAVPGRPHRVGSRSGQRRRASGRRVRAGRDRVRGRDRRLGADRRRPRVACLHPAATVGDHRRPRRQLGHRPIRVAAVVAGDDARGGRRAGHRDGRRRRDRVPHLALGDGQEHPHPDRRGRRRDPDHRVRAVDEQLVRGARRR